MQTVRISLVDGKPCSGHLLCGHGWLDETTSCSSTSITRSNQECDCQPCPMCGMRVGGIAVESCEDLHREFDDNNQRLSPIDGLPYCLNGCRESCERQNCTLCYQRFAGWCLKLKSDYTKNGPWVGPRCSSCDMDMFSHGPEATEVFCNKERVKIQVSESSTLS